MIITGCKESQKNIEAFGEDIERHIETLSSDEFEGCAPATAGGRKTVEYIESEFEDIGLRPAANGSYRQAVPLLEITGRDFSDLTISSENQNIHSFSHAAEQGRSLKPNTEPEKGYYFRSDHFNMVKKGVPMIYASAGSDYIGKDKAYAEKVRKDMSARYHQRTVLKILFDKTNVGMM